MRLEDMKNSIPDTPEFIHNMIQTEVEKQIAETKIINVRRNKHRKVKTMRVAAAVAACVLVTSTAAYAGFRLYHMYLEQPGTYSVGIGINAEDSSGKINLPEKLHDIEIQANYIPEGMEWMDEDHLVYPETPYNGGFSFSSVLMERDNLEQVMVDTGVVDSEETKFGEFEGVYLKYQDMEKDGSFNQRIYLLCPEEYRVIIIYIGDDISKEEAFKVAENLSIIKKDTMFETQGEYTWSELISPKEESQGDENLKIINEISEQKLQVYGVGDKFEIVAFGEDGTGKSMEKNISASVDSIQVADDLSLLDERELPKEWRNVVGPDEKLVENHLSYIKSGDGVNTLDEVVKTESVKQKLVLATVTYTNVSDSDINHMLYIGSVVTMKSEDGKYHIYNSQEQSGEGYDSIRGDGVARTGTMAYYSMKENYGNGGNYIASLESGESIQVEMAWIVNETDLDNMYLSLCSDGAAYEFSEEMLKTGLVNISQ